MKTKIIIIDDCVDLGLLLKKYLGENQDSKCLYFQNPESALEYLDSIYDKIVNKEIKIYTIVDIMMPTTNGLDLIKEMKKSYPHITYCILTGLKDERVIDKAFKIGVSEYIFKDKTINEIVNKITGLMNNNINETPEYIEIYEVSEIINQYTVKSINGPEIVIYTKDELPTSALINLKAPKGEHRLYRVQKCDLIDDGALITCLDFKAVS